MQTCMGLAGILLTLILWSLSVLTMYRLSGLTVKLVMMLQKWPRNSCGAWTHAATSVPFCHWLKRRASETAARMSTGACGLSREPLLTKCQIHI